MRTPDPTVPSARVILEDQSVSPSCLCSYHLYPGQLLRFGREPDANDVAIVHGAVSRKHLEFYVITFDDGPDHRPMVYVRDRQSTNGTFVNGHLIGQGALKTPGRLLSNHDSVTIEPYWRFTIDQDVGTTVRTSVSPLRPADAKTIKRFKITGRSLGSGAYATVFLAEDRKTHQQLMCKVHQLDRLSGNYILRAEREAVILSQLDHPNIMAFKQAFRSSSVFLLFAELATGGDLYSLLMTHGCFSELEAKWIVRQIVLAVYYMHTKGIVHRDLKLENILCAVCPSSTDRFVTPVQEYFNNDVKGVFNRKSVQPDTKRQLLLDSCEHGFGVDLWAIGVVTLKLITGEECSIEDMAAASSIEQWLDRKFSTNCRGFSFSQAGRHFISRCLTLEASDRITAAQALHHEWFSAPESDHAVLMKKEEETRAHWAPREVVLPIIQELPSISAPDAQEVARVHTKSAYFLRIAEQALQPQPRSVKRPLDTPSDIVPCKLFKCESSRVNTET
ncbi:uncharacterized protein PpBr36_05969 [Pyricularia pennisetigena]|uniref:uncharacterized protein n=1 Tax=Pyricularia pennisetigena TaxID=1578925 RepID=UPI001152C426|nr:uncharacterized protein PpBr36_05969 [Pyricularia pennisetigena]TLS22612.1 hypothetical protein PpBr36_05969 [Pyricularia pennisetigena]